MSIFSSTDAQAVNGDDFVLSRGEIEAVEKFYAYDYELFGYRRLADIVEKSVAFSDLRDELKSCSPTGYAYSKSVIEKYYEGDASLDKTRFVKRSTSYARFFTKAVFKPFMNIGP